jgi:glycerol-3-phosphate dehydrogenase
VEHERAETLTDFMLRRTGIGNGVCLGKDCCEQIARWMGELKGWSRERTDREVRDYLGEIALGQQFREAVPAGTPPFEGHISVTDAR